MSLTPYDAVFVMSFGGPREPDDVVPFLRNVTAGRGIPDERLREVGEHYYGFGGASPINAQNEALVDALRAELDRRGLDTPVALGNRNWTPYGDDVLRDLHAHGARRVVMLATSAYGSYSGCRQYREDLGRYLPALAAEGVNVAVDKVRPYFQLPGFVAGNVEAVVAAWRDLAERTGAAPRLVFVTHSIPTAMEEASGAARPATYDGQHRDLCATVAERAAAELGLGAAPAWDLVYCSRSGNPRIPWLEPDVNDFLTAEVAAGRLGPGSEAPGVILAPVGFVSDHLEVAYDLDTEAAATCESLGVPMPRAATVGTHDAFVAGLVDLLEERAALARGEASTLEPDGGLPAWTDVCPAGCCLLRPGQQDAPPAGCAEDSPPGL